METSFVKPITRIVDLLTVNLRRVISFNLLPAMAVMIFSTAAHAAYETYSVRRNSSQLTAGSSFFIVDGKFSQLGSATFADRDAHLELRFGVDERTSYANLSTVSNFTLNLKVTPYSSTNVAQAPINTSLTVSYSLAPNDAYVDMDFYELANYYKANIYITSVSGTVPQNVYLEGLVSADRFYHIDNAFTPSVSANHVIYSAVDGSETVSFNVSGGTTVGAGEIELAWNYITGAEEYELQYTWVDNYDRAASAIKMSMRDFELNNTRIITKGQSYRIPVVYDKGYLIYRVRAVGRWSQPGATQNLDKNYYGRWSTYGTSPTYVSDWSSKVQFTTSYEDLKNWQYQAVFAESGKKKEIVSFFDGSLRNRQTVTRINSNNEAIAGETVYDNQGRSAIQILPAPVANPALRYYETLNRNAAGTAAYNHTNFDWDNTLLAPCTSAAQTMSTAAGASKYYSANNTAENNWQDYVPQAGGYPFVQVEYTPDNTGRIRRQSGVGAAHAIGSGHETDYFYVQPYQEELNRLFGYEVGYKTRYKKNMVVDANGQVSISYIDPQGRVIATALGGSNTTGGSGADPSLLSLASEGGINHTNQIIDLLNKDGVNDVDTPLDDNLPFSTGAYGSLNDALVLSTQINATDDGSLYEFDYRIRTSSFSDGCMTAGKAYPFAYTLGIDVQNDCGNSVLNYASTIAPISTTVVGTTGAGYTGTTNVDQTFSFNSTLSTGSYAVSKIVQIDQAKLDIYLADYLANNTCLLTPTSFDIPSTIDCGDELTTDPVTICSVTMGMMLADVSPGGQYGDYNGGVGMDLSVFSNPNYLDNGTTSNTTYNWQNPSTPYMEADGVTASLVMYSGVLTNPKDLPLAVFIDEWRPSWAESLVPYHPEYCYKAFFDALCDHTETVNGTAYSTESFDAALMQLGTYAYGSNTSTNPFSLDLTIAVSGTWNIQSIDPYFDYSFPLIEGLTSLTPSENQLKYDLMNAILNDYHDLNISLLDFCIKAVVCGTDLAGTCTIPAIGTLSTAQKDQVWVMFRQMYISEKKKVNQYFVDLYALKNGCYNGYIGGDNTSGSTVNFLYYTTLIDDAINFYLDIAAVSEPWMGGGSYAGLFEDKQQRFVPISNLYDDGVPPTTAITELQQSTDENVYAQTGICPLAMDVQFFLDALAQGDYFDNSNIPATSLPAFTADLYTAMGGTIMTTGGTAVDIDNTINGSGNLEIVSSNASGGANLTDKITLNPPSGLSWSNYGTSWVIESMSMLYYIPGSLSGSTYSFQVLAEINQGGTITEVVMTGTTLGIEVGECQFDQPCERNSNLGSELVNVFSWLFAENQLTNTTTDVALSSNLSWYDNSELQMQLLDFGSGALYDGISAGVFDIKTTDYKITVNFGSSYPANMATITGGTLVGSTLTIWYFNTSDVLVSATATVTRTDLLPTPTTIAFDLDCGCDKEAELEGYIRDLVNSVLLAYNGGSLATPSGGPFNWPEVTAMDPYTSIAYPDLYNFAYPVQNPTSLVFAFDKDNNCRFAFGDGSNGVISGLVEVYNVQITYNSSGQITQITCVGLKSNGTTVNLQTTNTNPGCLSFEPCDGCIPQPVAPVSCTSAFTSYSSTINGLNSTILTAPTPDLDTVDAALFPIYTQTEFCDQNLAYITTAYLHYLTVMGVADLDNVNYLSIGEFGNTWLQYGYESGPTDLSDVVDLYETYEDTHAGFSWNEYVNTLYMNDTVCPPNPMATALPNITVTYPCEQLTQNADAANTATQYDIYLQNTIASFKQRYIEAAMTSLIENFTMEYPDKEFHYTLYYYDQAGNLVQTVPPAGVTRIESGTINEPGITSVRSSNPASPPTTPDVLPAHTLATNYRYNSLNQLISQTTPDGGTSYFAYDNLGRLVVSQNALQLSKNQMSYTKYDELGRIAEVGEMNVAAGTFSFNANGRLIYTSGSTLVDVSASNFPANISTSREEVTVTVYDHVLSSTVQAMFASYAANNTRNRITGVLYFNTVTGSTNMTTDYANATFYDYDVHGNVKEVVQQNKNADLIALTTSDQTIKKTVYEYELVSGNVKKVTYQKGKADQFAHKYMYDADNRITKVYTSANERIWEQDAKYFYYDHGPLARVEVGDKKVQATDYAYTIQGWLKGVNSEDLDRSTDIGNDAQKITTNRMNGKDAYAYSLHYFANDYDGRFDNNFLTYSESVVPTANTHQLYNGNIKEMYTNISKDDETILGASHTSYRYDQLNRIRSMNQEKLTTVTGTITLTAGRYESMYKYDANGNLDTLKRWADNGTVKTAMDDLKYGYIAGKNQLDHVDDAITSAAFTVDVDDQNAGNYVYDPIGQLTRDVAEDIDTIKWTVTGKVKEIIFNDALNANKTTTTNRIIFEYDAMGNRISKKVVPLTGTPTTTFYVYDAQGNPMSIYRHDEVGANKNLYLSERSMYGSSRIGVENIDQVVASTLSGNVNIVTRTQRHVGDKRFELSNHLGNVLNTVTDRKLPVTETVNYPCFDSGSLEYAASTTNLTPGLGTQMTLEAWVKMSVSTGVHTVAYFMSTGIGAKGMSINIINGKANLTGFNGTGGAGYSATGTTVVSDGKWHHVVGTSDNGVWKIYVDGQVEGTTSSTAGGFSGLSVPFYIGRAGAGTNYLKGCVKEVSMWNYTKTATEIENNFEDYVGYTGSETGIKGYWKCNDGAGTPNTLVDLSSSALTLTEYNSPSWSSDAMVDYYTADVQSYSDYFPFGMALPGRNGNADSYKYGYNGMEKDDEIKGSGNSYTTEFRQYDPRVGRWLSTDPLSKKFPWQSPYLAMDNNPVWFFDSDGDSAAVFRPDGTFMKFIDDGKDGWTGIQYTSTVKGTDGTITYTKPESFTFNDPGVAIQGIRNGVVTRIERVSEQKIEAHLIRSGIYSTEAQDSPWSYAKENSIADGKMDFAIQGYYNGDLNKNTLYITGDVAYDIADFGNYLWGRAMGELGFHPGVIQGGAHYNNFFNSRRDDKTHVFDLGPGTYGEAGWFDSAADQAAIVAGYSSSKGAKMRLERTMEAISKIDVKR